MVERSFLSDRTMEVTIPKLRARGLETKLGIDGRAITFDRNGTSVGPIDVVVIWAAREPQGGASSTTDVIGIDGELQGRIGELTVKNRDLFMIDNQLAEITNPTIPDRGIARAGFQMVTGGS